VTGAAFVALEGAALFGQPALEFVRVHEDRFLHANVEVHINVERARDQKGLKVGPAPCED
jgi:hypothetical protein